MSQESRVPGNKGVNKIESHEELTAIRKVGSQPSPDLALGVGALPGLFVPSALLTWSDQGCKLLGMCPGAPQGKLSPFTLHIRERESIPDAAAAKLLQLCLTLCHLLQGEFCF